MNETKEAIKVKSLEQTALEESEKAKPSSEPRYWAKRSCNACYGRGIVGTTSQKVDSNTLVTALLCHCVKVRFGKWRASWIQEYLDKHRDPVDSGIGSVVDKPQ